MPHRYIGHVALEHLLSPLTPESHFAPKWREFAERVGATDCFAVREYGTAEGHAHYHFFVETQLSRSTVYGRLR